MRSHLPLWILSAAILSPAVASAQEPAPQEGQFTVQRFEPAAGSRNYLTVEGARVDGQWGVTAGLGFNYARNPFVILSCQSETNCDDPNATRKENTSVVQDLFTWDLVGSVNPLEFLQVGLRVPVAFVKGAGVDANTGGPAMEGISAFAVGDPDLEAKARLFGAPKDPYVLGAAVDVSFPVGNATAEGAYFGNSSPVTVGLRGIFDGNFGPLSLGLNLKGVYRKDATLGSTTVGPEFRYGVGAGYRISPVFRVIAEGYGGTRFQAKEGTNSLEADGAFQVTPLSLPVVFAIGGGAGVIEGVGVPQARGLASILFVNEIGDQDGDGIDDKSDKCPTVAEDKDGFEDDDGCLDDDNDQDKVPDTTDKCPNQPETLNGVADQDGCPDELADRDKDGIGDADDKCPDQPGKIRTKEFYGCPDTDQDGVPDKVDTCVDQPEDTDGFQDTDGCPDPDNDGDGIADDRDECIDVPEVKNGFKDEDGCPDEAPDRDKDGIPDSLDKCPTQPETLNGIEDEDGCPEAGPRLVDVSETNIKILQKVEFATGSDKIQGAKSFLVLDAVVGALKTHKDIFLVEVAGHTDNVGPADGNRTLSQKRAEAVVAYMTSKGIEPQRLTPKGYGPDKPIADNKSTAGKQQNRRVEFNIVRSAKNPGTPPTGETPPPPTPAAPPPGQGPGGL